MRWEYLCLGPSVVADRLTAPRLYKTSSPRFLFQGKHFRISPLG